MSESDGSTPTGAPAGRRSAAAVVALVVIGCGLLGLALGVLWAAVSPRVPLVVVPGGAVPDEFQPGGFIAADGIFAVIGVIAGTAIASFLLWRDDRSLVVLAATVLGGLLGSLAMWWIGVRLGYSDVEAVAASSAEGTLLQAPLRLRMPGVLLLWPISSAAVVTATTLVDWWIAHRAARGAPPPVAEEPLSD